MTLWAEQTPAWQTAFEEAWTACLHGNLAIGASITDVEGRVIARGRNRLNETRSVDGLIRGHDLAHAEVNALLALPAIPLPEARAWTLHSTVEPCPQCAGALTMSGLRRLQFAARDPWAGSADLYHMHPYTASKRIQVTHAAPSMASACATLYLIGELHLNQNTSHPVWAAWADAQPTAARLALDLHARGRPHAWRQQAAPASEVFELLAQCAAPHAAPT